MHRPEDEPRPLGANVPSPQAGDTRIMPEVPGTWQQEPPPPAGPPPGRAGGPPAGRRPPRKRSGFGRFLRWLLALLLILVIAVAALVWFIWSRIDKVDAIPDDHGSAVSAGRVFLLVGSDSREDLSAEEQADLGTGDVAGQRTDSIMLMHIPTSGETALISIPRDSMVDIPGHGRNRLNAAFSYGGASLLVETLELNTGVAIDDYVQIGFGGFSTIVDALGGVEMCLDEAVRDEKAHIDLPAGCQELGGTEALGYARARYFDPRSDLGRVERQRELIAAISKKAMSAPTLLNPIELTRTGLAGGDALVLDESTGPFDMANFMKGMRSVSGDSGVTLTVPLGRVGNTVDWDQNKAGQLWSALQNGTGIPAELLED